MVTYIPILRWKRGEKVALLRLNPLSKQNVVPFIVIQPDQYVAQKATKKKPAVSAADHLIAEVQAYWGNTPFFLDASALATTAAGPHAITAIANAARGAGALLMPASKLGAPNAYRTAIAGIVAIDGRGAGLRVDLQELTTAAAWVGGMAVPTAQTHLIADFSDNVGNVLALGGSVTTAFNALHGAGQWLSVAVAGCSLPENFTGYSAGPHLITRSEWLLWQQLSAGVHGYEIGYGDYATVPPTAPPPGIRWGFPINVKYTLDSQFLVCRGVKTTGPAAVEMTPQLIGHAQQIRAHPGRNPLAHAWADGRVDRIAAGIETPGTLEMWVQIGVNRHIEKVRNDLP